MRLFTSFLKTKRIWVNTFVALLLFSFSLFFLPTIPSADTWWHIAGGEFLLQFLNDKGLIFFFINPPSDPFSFGPGRIGWINHEWLTEIFFFSIYKVFGLTSLYLFRSLVLFVAFVALPLLYGEVLNKRLLVTLFVILFSLTTAESQAFFDTRSYIFTYLGVSFLFFAIHFFRLFLSTSVTLTDGNIAAYSRYNLKITNQNLSTLRFSFVIFSSLLIVVWANLHGGFIIGVGLLFLASLAAFIEKRYQDVYYFTTCVVLALIGTVIFTPFGLETLQFPFSLLKTSAFSLGLNEWARPLSYQYWSLCLLLALYLLLFKKLCWFSRISTFVFILSAFTAWRHAPLASLACSFIFIEGFSLSSYLSRFFVKISHKLYLNKLLMAATWFALGFVFLILTAVFCGKYVGTGSRWTMENSHFPHDVISFLMLNPQLPRTIYAPYEWGGYLEYATYPQYFTFMDGRANTVYSSKRYSEALLIQYGDTWRNYLLKNKDKCKFNFSLDSKVFNWQSILDSYKINLAITTKIQGVEYEKFSKSKNWVLVYEDPVAAVFIRNNPQLINTLAEIRYPETSWSLFAYAVNCIRKDKPNDAYQYLDRALKLNPVNAQALVTKGMLELMNQRELNGIWLLFYAQMIVPDVSNANANFAIFAKSKGFDRVADYFNKREQQLSSNYW